MLSTFRIYGLLAPIDERCAFFLSSFHVAEWVGICTGKEAQGVPRCRLLVCFACCLTMFDIQNTGATTTTVLLFELDYASGVLSVSRAP